MDTNIYKWCRYNHPPYLGKDCPQCNRERQQRYRDKIKQPQRIIEFELGLIPFRGYPCVFPRHQNGTRLAYGGTRSVFDEAGYSYVWFGGRSFLLWKIIYVLEKSELPPPYMFHACQHKSCVNLRHLRYPTEEKPKLVYPSVRGEGDIVVNEAFPFSLKQWNEYKELQFVSDPNVQKMRSDYTDLEKIHQQYARAKELLDQL